LARALAPPPVAAEWCLPLVHQGGAVVLWVGPKADRDAAARAAMHLAGELVESPPGFLVFRKTGPTPPGFPRRPGMARKRPLR
jgi:16S rRNA (guanine527-N7)-methyltransferase